MLLDVLGIKRTRKKTKNEIAMEKKYPPKRDFEFWTGFHARSFWKFLGKNIFQKSFPGDRYREWGFDFTQKKIDIIINVFK